MLMHLRTNCCLFCRIGNHFRNFDRKVGINTQQEYVRMSVVFFRWSEGYYYSLLVPSKRQKITQLYTS